MLPPRRHRDDANFEYSLVAGGKIPTYDNVYDIILGVLGDCLISRPEDCLHGNEDSGGDKEQRGPKEEEKKEYSNGEDMGIKLTDTHVKRITDPIQPYYKKGRGNFIVLSLSGVLRKHVISKNSTIATIETLARNDGISQEIDVRNAISVVEEMFKKDISNVSGIRFLVESLFSVTSDRHLANEILSIIFAVIREATDEGRDDKEKEDTIQWLRRNVMAEYTCMTTTDNEELYLYDEKRGVYSP